MAGRTAAILIVRPELVALAAACHYAPKRFRGVGPTRATMLFGPD